MKLVVFSNHDKLHSETQHVVKLFEHGLETFHLRKPNFSSKDLIEYLNQIPKEYHKHIILHTHHKLTKKYRVKGVHFTRTHRKKKYNSNFKFLLFKIKHPTLVITRSCHKLHKLNEDSKRYSFVYLTPIFESISKQAHGGIFSDRQIERALKESENEVYALGGIEESKFEELKNLGFDGVALLGAIWNSDKSPLEAYLSATDKLAEVNQ